MEIKIENVHVTGDQLEAVIKLKGAILPKNEYGGYNIESRVIEMVAKRAAEQYVEQNMQTILGKIDEKSILNRILILVSDKFAGKQDRY